MAVAVWLWVVITDKAFCVCYIALKTFICLCITFHRAFAVFPYVVHDWKYMSSITPYVVCGHFCVPTVLKCYRSDVSMLTVFGERFFLDRACIKSPVKLN